MKNNLASSHVRLPRRERHRLGLVPILALSGATALFIMAAALPLWLPTALRIIPDRYIVAYAPDAIQRIVFVSDPSAQLPTAGAPAEEANQLLEQLESAPSLVPTQQPTLTPTSDGESSQAIFAPTANPTPNEATYDGPSTFYLSGFTYEAQGWNNCGPATITMMMSYWGVESTQNEAAEYLKPNTEDKNVSPNEIAAYINSLGFEAIARVNGNLNLLKDLIVAGFPVMIEQGYDPPIHTGGWMGHYLLLTGFSDDTQTFLSQDSYLAEGGPDTPYPYEHIEQFWHHFNRTYIVPYRPDQADLVASIIGADIDTATNYSNAVQTTQENLAVNPNDAFTWFNLGSSLVGLGRYQEAATAYDRARDLGLPPRMLWYQFGPYEAYYQVGRYTDVIELADDTVSGNVYANEYSEEAYYYEGLARAALGETGNARYLFNLALRQNSHFNAARQAIEALPTS